MSVKKQTHLDTIIGRGTKNMKLYTLLILFSITLPLGSLLAADGAIPIWEETVITESGHYYLARDIGDNPGGHDGIPAITITADDVDINLNGFALREGQPTIYADGVKGLSIHDGTLIAQDEALGLYNVERVELRRLRSFGGDPDRLFTVSGTSIIIEDCIITVWGNPALVLTGTNIVVRSNQFEGGDIPVDCTACRILDNSFLSTTLALSGSGNTVVNNVFANGSGVGVNDDGNMILQNTFKNSALDIVGDRNLIDSNLISEAGDYGLSFQGNYNVYRRNISRGNAGTGCTGLGSGADFCDEGTNNTSGGGNFMPDEM